MQAYYNPWTELEVLRRGIDELFGDFWPGPRGTRSAFLPGRSARGYPLLNVAEKKNQLVLEGLAPGLDPQSLEVSVQGDRVTIAGEKKPLPDVAPEAYHRSERATGRFERTLRLSVPIDENKVEASYRDGILTVVLPKAESAMPRKIEVKVK